MGALIISAESDKGGSLYIILQSRHAVDVLLVLVKGLI